MARITRKQIRRLIRQANMVELNGYQYGIEDYNCLTDTGVVLKLRGDQLTPRDFTMDMLVHAETIDDYTLALNGTKHQMVFIKFQRLALNGQK